MLNIQVKRLVVKPKILDRFDSLSLSIEILQGVLVPFNHTGILRVRALSTEYLGKTSFGLLFCIPNQKQSRKNGEMNDSARGSKAIAIVKIILARIPCGTDFRMECNQTHEDNFRASSSTLRARAGLHSRCWTTGLIAPNEEMKDWQVFPSSKR